MKESTGDVENDVKRLEVILHEAAKCSIPKYRSEITINQKEIAY